jgi:hypothetical protein
VCTERANTAVCSLIHAFNAKKARGQRIYAKSAFMQNFYARVIFPLKSKGLQLLKTFPHNFVHRKCAEQSAQLTERPCPNGQAEQGVHTNAGPAFKTSTHLNLNRINYLSQRKHACTHSFPQKVCKDAFGHKMPASHPVRKPAGVHAVWISAAAQFGASAAFLIEIIGLSANGCACSQFCPQKMWETWVVNLLNIV